VRMAAEATSRHSAIGHGVQLTSPNRAWTGQTWHVIGGGTARRRRYTNIALSLSRRMIHQGLFGIFDATRSFEFSGT
jgi:hypothetical protein